MSSLFYYLGNDFISFDNKNRHFANRFAICFSFSQSSLNQSFLSLRLVLCGLPVKRARERERETWRLNRVNILLMKKVYKINAILFRLPARHKDNNKCCLIKKSLMNFLLNKFTPLSKVNCSRGTKNESFLFLSKKNKLMVS